jgi:hypothetical protein
MMMKRLRLIGLVLGCLFSLPDIAHAGIIEWIDQMSGPGPFLGFTVEGRIHCFGTDKVPAPKPDQTEAEAQDRSRYLGVILKCFNDLPNTKRPWITVNLAGGVSWALKNDLQDDESKKKVIVYSFEPSLWWYPIPPLAVGTAVGHYSFTGAAFDTFSRLYWKPVQVEVKPLAFSKHHWGTKWEVLTFRAGYTFIPEGFTAEDFGSTKPYMTDHEHLPTLSVLLDLGTIKGMQWWH